MSDTASQEPQGLHEADGQQQEYEEEEEGIGGPLLVTKLSVCKTTRLSPSTRHTLVHWG